MPDTACAGGRRGLPVLLIRGARDDELRADHRELRRRDGRRFAASFGGAQRYWARRNGCAGGVARDSTGAVVEIAALGCPAGLDVRQLVVAGQGHAWPGGHRPMLFSPAPSPRVNASERIVAFFEQEALAKAGGAAAATAR
jgi:poly(3-hydroxybutyrate) depolymerase